MSLGKILFSTALILFSVLFFAVLYKKSDTVQESSRVAVRENAEKPFEVELEPLTRDVTPAPKLAPVELPKELNKEPRKEATKESTKEPTKESVRSVPSSPKKEESPEVDRIDELFNTKGSKLPIVETLTYKSRVAWLKGRPAWLSDYASHYSTSRHFIARSLNGKAEYLKQDIGEGDKFNILKPDYPIEFYLVIDTSTCKLWFYYIDGKTHEKCLLKTYPVSLGRPDNSSASGLLTPLGKYSLGSRIATYKPGVMGQHKTQKVEMVSIFGTRWIPFEKEIGQCTAPAKGLGLHGVPWQKTSDGKWEENLKSLNHYESDGCIRLSSKDIEEIYAIVVTKPTFVELVKDIADSELIVK